MIKYITSEYEKKKKKLLRIINKIFDEGTLAEDFMVVNFISMAKKNYFSKMLWISNHCVVESFFEIPAGDDKCQD